MRPGHRMFTPASVKRPHWVLLGFERSLRAPRTQRHQVLGRRLVSFADDQETGGVHVVDEACPHRGASMAGGTVRDGCLVCPHHGERVGVNNQPDRFYDHATLQGLVWVDFARNLITQHHMPPYFPELSSPEYQVADFSRDVDANPLLLHEAFLGWRASVDGAAVTRTGPVGVARFTCTTPYGDLDVEQEYHVPFTSCTRFVSSDGRIVAVVVLGVQPVSKDRARLHVRIARAPDDGLAVRSVVGLLLREATALAGGADASAWRRNRLTPGRDALLGAYREALERQFPDLLEYCIT